MRHCPPSVVRLPSLEFEKLATLTIGWLRFQAQATSQQSCRAYQHSDGFYVFPVNWKNREFPGTRIHVFLDANPPASNIVGYHDHPWDFRSVVLAGSVKNRVISEKRGGAELHKYRCAWNPEQHQYEWCHLLSSEFGVVQSVDSGQGSAYSLEHSVPHYATSTTDVAITVVRRGRFRRGWSNVFLKSRRLPGQMASPRRLLTPVEANRVAGCAIDSLLFSVSS